MTGSVAAHLLRDAVQQLKDSTFTNRNVDRLCERVLDVADRLSPPVAVDWIER